MLHPKNIPDHKNAVQLVCYFSQGKIFAGCDTGVNVETKNLLINFDNWEKITEFDFNDYCNETSDYNQIENNFSKIIQILTDNLDLAKKNNNHLLKLDPSIGTKEIAEGNAEQSNEKDINLFDPYEKNNDKTKQSPNPDSLKIKNAKYQEKKEIYPNIRKDEDYLERKKIGEYIAKELISNKNIEPLNIGIYGNWGSGKTQIFYFIKEFLQTQNEKQNSSDKEEKEKPYICEIIDFDAWQYNDQEHIWANLIMKILNSCNKYPSFYFLYMFNKLKNYIKNSWQEVLLKFIIIFILFNLIIYANQILSFPIIEKISEFNTYLKIFLIVLITILPDLFKLRFVNIDKEFLKCFKLPSYNEQLGFKDEIQELLNYALTYLGKKRGEESCTFYR